MCGTPSYIHSDREIPFLSKELKEYTAGNSHQQNHTLQLSLKSSNLPVTKWELVLPDAFHSIRSLLCTATNATPHERFYNFQRRSSLVVSLPTWLQNPGPVLLWRFVRTSKHDPLVDQVQLTEANPAYALVEYPDGRQSTVSLRDLAPCPAVPVTESTQQPSWNSKNGDESSVPQASSPSPIRSSLDQEPELRRSTGQIKPPCRYGWWNMCPCFKKH